MNGNRIFLGKIMKCNYYKLENGCSVYSFLYNPKTGKEEIIPDEVVKTDAVLIKVADNSFVDLDLIRNNFDLLRNIVKNSTLKTFPKCCGDLYLDEGTLRPYYDEEKQNISVKQLKILRNSSINDK